MLVSSISRIQTDLSAGRIHATYVHLVLNGVLGLFHNRYFDLWGPASECLAVLLRNHTRAVWSDFVCYLGHCQLKFETLHNHIENANHSMAERHTGKYISISSAHIMSWFFPNNSNIISLFFPPVLIY